MQVTQFQLLFIELLRKSKNTIIVLSPCYFLKTLVVNVTFNLATETGTLLNLVGRSWICGARQSLPHTRGSSSFSYLNTCPVYILVLWTILKHWLMWYRFMNIKIQCMSHVWSCFRMLGSSKNSHFVAFVHMFCFSSSCLTFRWDKINTSWLVKVKLPQHWPLCLTADLLNSGKAHLD